MVLATNRKAYHEYEIIEKFEAGIALQGTEVKSIRQSKINLKESYVRVINNEVVLVGCHISPYDFGNRFNHDPLRSRILLLHRKEINKLVGKVNEKGLALTALKVYLKKGLIKVEIALVRGKKLYDKRRSEKEKDLSIEMNRALKSKTD